MQWRDADFEGPFCQQLRVSSMERGGYEFRFVVEKFPGLFGICGARISAAPSGTLHWGFRKNLLIEVGVGAKEPSVVTAALEAVSYHLEVLESLVSRRADERSAATELQKVTGDDPRLEWSAFVEKPWKPVIVYQSACPNCGQPLKFIYNPWKLSGFLGCKGWPDCTGPYPKEGQESRPVAHGQIPPTLYPPPSPPDGEDMDMPF